MHFYSVLSESLTIQKVTNLIVVETGFLFSRVFRKAFILGKPWSASIEPTTSCNLRCPECPTGMQSLTRAKGSLDVEVYKTILDKLSPDLIYLTLYFQGEPFLNPHFPEMVKLARNRRIFVATSTNGHYLDDTNVAKIIQSGLSHLIISLDGLDQETYEKYRVKGNLQTVTDGIKRVVAAKKATKSKFPFIELQFLVMRHNEHQMNAMRNYAEQAGVDKLSFKSAQVYNFDTGNTIIPTLKQKSRYRELPDGSWIIARKIKNRCHRIWSSLVVTWDGKVVPCCYDKDADHQTGNLLQDSLDDIWKNKVISSYRNQVLSSRADIEICRNCGE
jgi:radical SAM protein with 4Fe4S-binding SPASM domain